MTILIIEDEQKMLATLEKGLRANGYDVNTAPRGDTGLEMAMKNACDLIVLDIMLPGRDGLSVMTSLREAGKQTPVIFLTARDGIDDRVKGLELGADDYLVKPFELSELLARIKAILRRTPERQPEIVKIGDLEIDLFKLRVIRGGKKLDLSPKEFALLSLLTRRAGEPQSRERIAREIWELSFDSASNFVDVHVRRLRAKVDDPFDKKMIQTIRGVGYVIYDQPHG
jgi:two-component system copper resistance phosphate regulon response regulator CusR